MIRGGDIPRFGTCSSSMPDLSWFARLCGKFARRRLNAEVEEDGVGLIKGRRKRGRGGGGLSDGSLGGEQGIPSSLFPLDPSPSGSHLLAFVSQSPQPPQIRHSRPSPPDLLTSRLQVHADSSPPTDEAPHREVATIGRLSGNPARAENGHGRSTGRLTRVMGSKRARSSVSDAAHVKLLYAHLLGSSTLSLAVPGCCWEDTTEVLEAGQRAPVGWIVAVSLLLGPTRGDQLARRRGGWLGE